MINPPNGKSPQRPPVTVVGGGIGQKMADMIARGRMPSSNRPFYKSPEEGLYGLGTGPPDLGVRPAPFHLPGGGVFPKLKHPAFSTVERLFRVLPEEAFFDPDLSPSRPFAFPLGAFEVPPGQQMWMTDYEFSIMRQSGVDPGDTVFAEDGRFSNVIGFDVNISGNIRLSNILYQLDPQPLQLTRAQFAPPTSIPGPGFLPATPADIFDASAAASFGSTAGIGDSLLPVRQNVQGPRGGPFTFVVDEGAFVNLGAVLFRPFTTPIAAVQGRLAGFLIHTNVSQTLLNRLSPR